MANTIIIDKVGNESKQNIKVVLSDGETLSLYLWFSPICSCWFVNVNYKDFVLNGLQLVYSNNILIQYERIFPFGMQIASRTGLSPMLIDSFVNELNAVIINEF